MSGIKSQKTDQIPNKIYDLKFDDIVYLTCFSQLIPRLHEVLVIIKLQKCLQKYSKF
jgi:hypothetical protein